jgi:hypothetical protein
MHDTDLERTDRDLKTTLYKHIKREKWGLAVLAWEGEGKRGYQFEDGVLRVFKDGYFHLMREVDRPADETERVMVRLNRALGRREASKSRKSDTLISFDDQITILRRQFPGGFAGEKWQQKMRGVDAGQQLKRHREPALRLARELLSEQSLTASIARQDFDGVLEALLRVLRNTNLVRPAQLNPLERLPRHRVEQVALALRELLHGEGALRDRMGRWISALGSPSWELATAPAALVDPERHICVRPKGFRDQAQWMAPRLEHSKEPTAEVYLRYQAMAGAVLAKLQEEGLHPRDMLDVHDFIWTTLRPAARKLLEQDSAADDKSDEQAA